MITIAEVLEFRNDAETLAGRMVVLGIDTDKVQQFIRTVDHYCAEMLRAIEGGVVIRSDIHIDGDRWVQFSEGEPVSWSDENGWTGQAPADWQDPTCAVTEPCDPVCSKCYRPRSNWDSACHCGWTVHGQPPLIRSRTVAHVVQDWGPWPVVERPSQSPDKPCVTILPRGMAMLWPRDGRPDDEPPSDIILNAYPPDVDPASLVGQWARGGRAVAS